MEKTLCSPQFFEPQEIQYEVFANDGEQTMTAWIYTPQSAEDITFAADGKATITAEQFELNL